jgi:phosphatidylinositol glycan class F
MTVVGAAAHLGLNGANFKRLFIMFSVVDVKERWILGLTLGAIAGAWFGVWPVPLDWERWWQVWPIPSLVGSLIGYLLAIVILSLMSLEVFQRDNGADKVRTD